MIIRRPEPAHPRRRNGSAPCAYRSGHHRSGDEELTRPAVLAKASYRALERLVLPADPAA
jgi:hypothetical protein